MRNRKRRIRDALREHHGSPTVDPRTINLHSIETFFDAFDALSITYVLPVVVPAWKLTPTATGWLISAGFLGQLIGALVGGALAERIGRRPVIVAAVLWSFAALLLFPPLRPICLASTDA